MPLPGTLLRERLTVSIRPFCVPVKSDHCRALNSPRRRPVRVRNGGCAAGAPDLPAVFQLAAYHLTEELHLWHKHPLVAAFESAVSGKSENYISKEVL